jgi:hypothetical protein
MWETKRMIRSLCAVALVVGGSLIAACATTDQPAEAPKALAPVATPAPSASPAAGAAKPANAASLFPPGDGREVSVAGTRRAVPGRARAISRDDRPARAPGITRTSTAASPCRDRGRRAWRVPRPPRRAAPRVDARSERLRHGDEQADDDDREQAE